MREGSYMEIEPGMKVVGPDGEGIGSVDQVISDEASGIFHGLSVRHGLLAHAIATASSDQRMVARARGSFRSLNPDTPEERTTWPPST